MKGMLKKIAGGLALLLVLGAAFGWIECRVFVPHDKCLVLTHKSGAMLPEGEKIAGPNQRGIQREVLGPGRYFFNPVEWSWELKDLVHIPAGNPASWGEYYAEAASDTAFPTIKGDWPQVGLLVNKLGKTVAGGQEVVNEGEQGIQKEVLTPGTYRINPYIYEVKLVPATIVPLGCCGVVTSMLGDMPGYETIQDGGVGPSGQPGPDQERKIQKMASVGQRGVMRAVLQPGIYYLNPYQYKVDIVQVGYNEISQSRSTQDASAHISFPSKDGFLIEIDATVVWGRHPAHIAEMINRFGDLGRLKQIILGQMRSICRNLGSEYESTDFIRGEKRELYQKEVTETLRRVCHQRDIDLLIALISNIEVHGSPEAEKEGMDLKKTIQSGFIARERELTKQAQRETASVKAELETAKVAVEIARERVSADTRKKVAEIMADAQKDARQTDAQRDLDVAVIERQIAELDAEKTRVLGKTKAAVDQLRNTAEADGRRMMIEALGSGRAYNLLTFAENFSPDAIRLIFAGPGTFWTDLSKAQDAASLELLRSAAGK